MRPAALCLLLAAAVAGGCASPETSGGGDASAALRLSPDVCPFDAPPGRFSIRKGAPEQAFHVVPGADGATAKLVLEGLDGPAMELHVTRKADSLYFSPGPELGAELIRGGADPGTTWDSDGWRITFEGWEPVVTASGRYDAARIAARRGPAKLQWVQTWWFARGVGLLRMRQEKGPLYSDEMVRTQ